VFGEDGAPQGGGGGFDVVLGNPPWERIKLQEKEFFAVRDPEITNAPNAAARRRLISKLPKTNPAVAAEYAAALRRSECTSEFLRNSGRFPLTGVGDVNTYAVFAGLARSLIDPRGRVGIVIPSGIATDYTYRDFFANLMETGHLSSLYDFENRRALFPGTHRSYKYSLVTLAGEETPTAEFAFFLLSVDDLADDERRFTLSQQDLALINPNTRTCPIFRTRTDAELTRKTYHGCPVLHNEETGESPWDVSFLRMFDMANDSHLFRTRQELDELGYSLQGNRLLHDNEVCLPMYEDWMIHQYDHRYRSHATESSHAVQHPDADSLPLPRYWMGREEVQARVSDRAGEEPRWLFGFRKRTRSTDIRTGVFSIIPYSAVGDPVPLMSSRTCSACLFAGLVGDLNSLPLDYALRQKIGGLNFNFYILEQLPVLPPNVYTRDLVECIAPSVLELTYTAWDIKAFADDVWREADEDLRKAIIRQWEANVAETGGHVGAEPSPWVELAPDGFPHPPFKWDQQRRVLLRAELDALYAHLYGLTREELDYILDTFPIVRRKDEAKYGEYRTKRMVLEQYEELAGRFD
jgi:hypothetical protein